MKHIFLLALATGCGASEVMSTDVMDSEQTGVPEAADVEAATGESAAPAIDEAAREEEVIPAAGDAPLGEPATGNSDSLGDDEDPAEFCGNAAVDGDEVCDDGVNDGRYNGCRMGCTGRSAYCGDGVVDPGEGCDDAVNDGSEGSCFADCSAAVEYCGDGIINGTEGCDDGTNDGTFGHCLAGCTALADFELGPFSNWLNVQDYGAVGDGLTDDTDAIQTALHALDNQHRTSTDPFVSSTLYFPAGTYLISERVTLVNYATGITTLVGLEIKGGQAGRTCPSVSPGCVDADTEAECNANHPELTGTALTNQCECTCPSIDNNPLATSAGLGISIIGEDPETTTLKWAGSPGGILLSTNGMSSSRIHRLTFDGDGIARTLIHLASATNWEPDADISVDGTWHNYSYETANELADLRFQNADYGIRTGAYNGTGSAELTILRCHFINNRTGYQSNAPNSLDTWFRDSYFEQNEIGITNGDPDYMIHHSTYGYGADAEGNPIPGIDEGNGNFIVDSSVFVGSGLADIAVHPSSDFRIRHNTSIGSEAFFITKNNGRSGSLVTLQDNLVLDSASANAIQLETMGPVLLLDNTVRSLAANTGPVVTNVAYTYGDADTDGDGTYDERTYYTLDVTAVGNTFTVEEPFSLCSSCATAVDPAALATPRVATNSAEARLIEIETEMVDRASVTPELDADHLPAIPAVPRWHGAGDLLPPGYDYDPAYVEEIGVPVGATYAETVAVIQEAIDRTVDYEGYGPIVHLHAGSYRIDATLTVRAGSDVQIVGDGPAASDKTTVLIWAGDAGTAGPILRLAGPSRAGVQNLTLFGGTPYGLYYATVDPPVADGIEIDGVETDQDGNAIEGGRILVESATGADRFLATGFFVDRLDSTLVELREGGSLPRFGGVAYKVVGGQNAALGIPGNGRVNLFSGSSGGTQTDSPAAIEVSQGGRLLLQGFYEESAPGLVMSLDGSGTLTIDGKMGTGEAQIGDFDGNVTFIGTQNYSPIYITADATSETHVLGLGLGAQLQDPYVAGDDYLICDSSSAQWALLNSRESDSVLSGSVAVSDDGSFDVSDTTVRDAFILEMLTHLREEQPLGRTANVPVGATDVRLTRVMVYDSVNAFHFTP